MLPLFVTRWPWAELCRPQLRPPSPLRPGHCHGAERGHGLERGPPPPLTRRPARHRPSQLAHRPMHSEAFCDAAWGFFLITSSKARDFLPWPPNQRSKSQEHELLAAAQLVVVSAEIILMLNPYLDFSFLNIRNAEQSMEACRRFRATLYLWTFFASATLYMNFLIWRVGMEELGMEVEKTDMIELTDHIFVSFLPLSFLVVVFYIDAFNGHVLREDMALAIAMKELFSAVSVTGGGSVRHEAASSDKLGSHPEIYAGYAPMGYREYLKKMPKRRQHQEGHS